MYDFSRSIVDFYRQPVDIKVENTIKSYYWRLLDLGLMFGIHDGSNYHKIFVAQSILFGVSTIFHVWCIIETIPRIWSMEITVKTESLHIQLMLFQAICLAVSAQMNRRSLSQIHACFSERMYDYTLDVKSIENLTRRKTFVFLFIPRLLYAMISVVCVLLWAVAPYLNEYNGAESLGVTNDINTELPAKIWYPFDTTRPIQLYLTLFVQLISSGQTSLIGFGYYMMASKIISRILEEFEILLHAIDIIDSSVDAEIEETGQIHEKLFEDRMKLIIEHHQRIMEVTKLFCDFQNIPIFVIYSSSVLSTAFAGFIVFDTSKRLGSAFFSFGLLALEVISAFSYNWWGQKLLDYSDRIADTLYSTNWLARNKSNRKLIQTMMVMTQCRPARIKCLMWLLNLQKFRENIYISYRLFSAMLALKAS